MNLRLMRAITLLLLLLVSLPTYAQYGGGGSQDTVDDVVGDGEYEVYVTSGNSEDCAVGEALDFEASQDDSLAITVLLPPGNYSPVAIRIVGTSLELITPVSSDGEISFDFPLSGIPTGTYNLTVNGFVFFELTVNEGSDGDYEVVFTSLINGEATAYTTSVEGIGQSLIGQNDMLNRMVTVSSEADKLAYIADPLPIDRLPLLGANDLPELGDCADVDDEEADSDGEGVFVDGSALDSVDFNSRIDGTGSLLMMSDRDGSNAQVLRNDGEFSDPIWSPDGTLVIYVAKRDGVVDLYAIDVDTLEETRITDDDTIEMSPTISPDGSELVYVVDNEGVLELWLVAIDGGEPEALLIDDYNNTFPAYSPDGSQIAFSSDRIGQRSGIYLLDIESGMVSIVVDTEHDEIQPAWSPDGSIIIYSAFNPRNSSYDLYVLSLTGEFETMNISNDAQSDEVNAQIIRVETD